MLITAEIKAFADIVVGELVKVILICEIYLLAQVIIVTSSIQVRIF
jgi:hypothetical protein